MKNIFFYLFLFLSQIFFAQTSFDKGNKLYQSGNYKKAIQCYENIIQSEKLQSAELYFNLGNCYYKLNKVAPAIYNYEKALILKPNDPDILNNLKFAKKLTIDEIKEVPKVGFSKLLRNFTGVFSYNNWAWFSIGTAFAFLLCFIGYYFSSFATTKRIYFISMFLLLFILIIGIFSGISERNYYKNERPAIVFSENVEVRSEPQKAGSTIFVLHEGTKVYIRETLDNWKKIELTDGTEGWIDSSSIKEVK